MHLALGGLRASDPNTPCTEGLCPWSGGTANSLASEIHQAPLPRQ